MEATQIESFGGSAQLSVILHRSGDPDWHSILNPMPLLKQQTTGTVQNEKNHASELQLCTGYLLQKSAAACQSSHTAWINNRLYIRFLNGSAGAGIPSAAKVTEL